MSLTTRHYKLVAGAIKLARERSTVGSSAVADAIVGEIAQAFYDDNDRFDPVRFRRACQPEGASHVPGGM